MTEITIQINDTGDVFMMLDELTLSGFVMNTDYEWFYQPSIWDYSCSAMIPRSVLFKCPEPVATWIGLRYGSKV